MRACPRFKRFVLELLASYNIPPERLRPGDSADFRIGPEGQRSAMMPFGISLLSRTTLAAYHFFVQEGDVVWDPEVVFYIEPTRTITEAEWIPIQITHPPSLLTPAPMIYAELNDDATAILRVAPKGQRDLASFVENLWTKNLRATFIEAPARLRMIPYTERRVQPQCFPDWMHECFMCHTFSATAQPRRYVQGSRNLAWLCPRCEKVSNDHLAAQFSDETTHEVYRCDNCHRTFQIDEDPPASLKGSWTHCPHCLEEEGLAKCACCGEVLLQSETFLIHGSDPHIYVCPNCYPRSDLSFDPALTKHQDVPQLVAAVGGQLEALHRVTQQIAAPAAALPPEGNLTDQDLFVGTPCQKILDNDESIEVAGELCCPNCLATIPTTTPLPESMPAEPPRRPVQLSMSF